MADNWVNNNTELFLWIVFTCIFIGLCVMVTLPRWLPALLGWMFEDAEKLVRQRLGTPQAGRARDHPKGASEEQIGRNARDASAVGPTSDDAVRRLLHARQALQPLLDGEDRQTEDGQLLKLRDVRSEAQAEVQRLFDMAMTTDKLRTIPTVSS